MVITKLVLVYICTSVMCLKCNFFLVSSLYDDRVARLGPLKFVASCSSLLDHQISRRQEYLNARGGDHRLSRTQLGWELWIGFDLPLQFSIRIPYFWIYIINKRRISIYAAHFFFFDLQISKCVFETIFGHNAWDDSNVRFLSQQPVWSTSSRHYHLGLCKLRNKYL